MEEYKLTLGLGITGSFCTFGKILRTTEALVQKGIKVIPVYSRHAATLDTRFMTAEVFQNRMQEITGERGIQSIVQAETIGPSGLFDVMAIAPWKYHGKAAAGHCRYHSAYGSQSAS